MNSHLRLFLLELLLLCTPEGLDSPALAALLDWPAELRAMAVHGSGANRVTRLDGRHDRERARHIIIWFTPSRLICLSFIDAYKNVVYLHCTTKLQPAGRDLDHLLGVFALEFAVPKHGEFRLPTQFSYKL